LLTAELDRVALRESFMSTASSLTTSRNYCHEFVKVMSATTVKLLRAAAEIVGDEKALSERLGIAETLLAKFMVDICELPDLLLLRTVDIILEDRQSRFPFPTAGQSREESEGDRQPPPNLASLPEALHRPQNVAPWTPRIRTMSSRTGLLARLEPLAPFSMAASQRMSFRRRSG
jgi:hypothetical protein